MSTRAIRMSELADQLTRVTGIQVRVVEDAAAAWTLHWADGPTVARMYPFADAARGGRRTVELSAYRMGFLRHQTPRAWAARAIAAHRDGTLAQAVATGGAARRAHPTAPQWEGRDVAPEDHAVLAHVERLFDSTDHPDRADDEADEPSIAALLRLGEHSPERMSRLLNTPRVADTLRPARRRLQVVPRA
ncbi:hypothetical protein [Yinghuangia seranimata]|uniref:hypothetical protein n=1 Tax=Yinghuangia seranimata TaxID=408067 RepID=UPI00248C6F8B|nr:hypothetical protein [Yinghuangia seranimata]MDI2129592.1 hypothetical protein [Yinghuangia seranimata]